MKGIAHLVAFGLLACAGSILPAGVQAAVIQEFQYDLWSHPDGNAAPPSYGLRLDGIEWFISNGVNGGDSDIWTFDFTDMKATYTYNSMADDTFRIFGTAVGGRDLSGGNYDEGQFAEVSIDFTYTGFNGQNSHVDPEIHVNGAGGVASSLGMGTITFEDAVFSIAQGTTVNLLAFANSAGRLFNFDVDPAPGHRLEDYCGGANPPHYCGMPAGWGWLALKDNDWVYHTAAQDWLFVSKARTIPEPSSLVMLVSGIGMFSLFCGVRIRRRRTTV